MDTTILDTAWTLIDSNDETSERLPERMKEADMPDEVIKDIQVLTQNWDSIPGPPTTPLEVGDMIEEALHQGLDSWKDYEKLIIHRFLADIDMAIRYGRG